jgi:hypothetical protein
MSLDTAFLRRNVLIKGPSASRMDNYLCGVYFEVKFSLERQRAHGRSFFFSCCEEKSKVVVLLK